MGTPFGFPDWQKQTPWDGPLLLDVENQFQNTNNFFGPVYVGRWARVAGELSSDVTALWTFTWYADQAHTIALGSRTLVTDPGTPNPMVFALPNLGPWVRLNVQVENPIFGFHSTTRLFGTNRQQPLDVVPGSATLASNAVGLVVPALSQVMVPLDWYYAGAATLWFTRAAQTRVSLHSTPTPGGGQWVVQYDNVAANSDLVVSFIVPPVPCQLVFLDEGNAASTAFYTLTASFNVAA